MKQIVLVQPNFKFGVGSLEGYWLPYSVGCLWSYAKQFAWVVKNYNLADIVFRREPIDDFVARHNRIDVAFFSCYMWNWEYNKKLAQQIKQKFPQCFIVMGGPQVTDKPTHKFFTEHQYVDSVCLTEGEETFTQILEQIQQGDTPLSVYQGARLNDLEIPSPMLSGVFDNIIKNNPDYVFNITLETNRGCPFQCTFCDWGSLTYAKIRKFPLEKVFAELKWIADNKIDFVTIADANFGVFFERDMAITDELLRLQKTTGYPRVVDATWYKNASDKVLQIVKKFTTGGFNRGMTLSVQSMDDNVLETIKRKNMDISNLKELFAKCNKEGIQSYSELILGLPEETYDSWADGLCSIIEAGQHGAIESWLLQLLENAELNTPEQRKLHGLETVIAQGYVSGSGAEDEILENAELVVGTRYMPREQLAQGWMYSWMINNFHCFGWTQVYTRWKHTRGMPYRIMYDHLLSCIKQDTGLVNRLYSKAQDNIRHYLKTGMGTVEFDGHTLLWDAQQEFHKNRSEILNFVDSVYTKEFLQIDKDLWFALRNYQRVFTTSPHAKYPYKVDCEYNFDEFLKGNKLTKQPTSYIINIPEPNLSESEYMSRLYFRRRQGFGKSIIKAESILPGDDIPLTPSKGKSNEYH